MPFRCFGAEARLRRTLPARDSAVYGGKSAPRRARGRRRGGRGATGAACRSHGTNFRRRGSKAGWRSPCRAIPASGSRRSPVDRVPCTSISRSTPPASRRRRARRAARARALQHGQLSRRCLRPPAELCRRTGSPERILGGALDQGTFKASISTPVRDIRARGAGKGSSEGGFSRSCGEVVFFAT